ncbi:unnamed protein product [Rhizophagus irregularis]|nr:unnamed protein product [Rhizophagus irregularis]
MIFVPYENFKNIEPIGEGGFSKIYKATWIDCKISNRGTLDYSLRNNSQTVALKKLNDSKNITSNELNELKMFYHYSSEGNLRDVYSNHRSLVNVYYECWHSDPEKRPTAVEVLKKIEEIWKIDTIIGGYSKTKIIKSPKIGPVTTNNPDAIYKSRHLSVMIESAASARISRSQPIALDLDRLDYRQRNFNDKRKFEDNQFGNSFDNGTSNKKIKPIEDENNVYATKEFEFDIDINSIQSKDDGYITREIDFDIL